MLDYLIQLQMLQKKVAQFDQWVSAVDIRVDQIYVAGENSLIFRSE